MTDFFDTADIAALCGALSAAGEALMANQGNPDWRDVLDENGLKTRADLDMNARLVSALNEVSPGLAVFSEETPHAVSDRPERYWLIDPIDGTASWINGFSGYVTQAAFIEDNIPVFGMIHHPHSGRLWRNNRDGEILCNEEVVTPPSVPSSGWRLIDNYPDPRGTAKGMMAADQITGYIECGSLGLKSILTLTGEAELFVKSTRTRDWDLAPAMAMARAGHGAILNKQKDILTIGSSIEFNEGLIVSHDAAIAAWAADWIDHNQIF